MQAADQITADAAAEYRRECVDELQRAYTQALIDAQTLRTPEAWIAAGEAFDRFIDLAALLDEEVRP